MEAERVADAGARVLGPEVGALDLGGLGDVRHAADAVADVHEVAAGFLREAVAGGGVGVLAPVVFDLGAGGEAVDGGGFGAGAVGGEVDVGGGAGEEDGHCFVVGTGVVEEDGDANGGFHHYFRGLVSVVLLNW